MHTAAKYRDLSLHDARDRFDHRREKFIRRCLRGRRQHFFQRAMKRYAQFRIHIDSKFGYAELILTNGVRQITKPELVITSFEATDSDAIGDNNEAEVPIRVVVTNMGNVAAGTFPLSAEATSKQGDEVISLLLGRREQ